jgi:hypothetical protein
MKHQPQFLYQRIGWAFLDNYRYCGIKGKSGAGTDHQ